jgi:hypothetical protein
MLAEARYSERVGALPSELSVVYESQRVASGGVKETSA